MANPAQRLFLGFGAQTSGKCDLDGRSRWRWILATGNDWASELIWHHQITIDQLAGRDQRVPQVLAGRFEQVLQPKGHVAGMLRVWVNMGRLIPFQVRVH